MKRTEEELKILYTKFDKDISQRARWYRFLLVLDQMLNVLWLNGSQDETCSSHIYRKMKTETATGFQIWMCCKILSKLEHNHCFKSRGE